MSDAGNVVANHRMVEVGAAVPGLAGCRVAADIFVPASGPREPVVFCCLPGGAMSRGYWDLRPTGDDTYSFALWMAGAGFPVICVDHLGTGGSVLPVGAQAPLLEQVVAANDAAFRTLLHELGGHDPLRQWRSVGVGHSMGAMMTVRQQAAYTTYDAVALLGFGLDGLPSALSPEVLAACADGIPDDEHLAELALGMFGAAYPGRSREPTAGATLHGGSSAAVKGALAAARTVLLGAGGLLSMLPGNVAVDAVRLRVPVLVMNGERDSLIDGRQTQARQYHHAPSFATHVLPDMGHNQNVAPTRHELWDELRRWAESAVAG